MPGPRPAAPRDDAGGVGRNDRIMTECGTTASRPSAERPHHDRVRNDRIMTESGTSPPLDTAFARAHFPALAGPWALFENAGGTLAAAQVLDRIRTYMAEYQVQPGAAYPASAGAAEMIAGEPPGDGGDDQCPARRGGDRALHLDERLPARPGAPARLLRGRRDRGHQSRPRSERRRLAQARGGGHHRARVALRSRQSWRWSWRGSRPC